MARDITLTVQARASRGRSEARKMRAEGLLPGVIYGPEIEAESLAVPRIELLRVLNQHGRHPLVTIEVSGGRSYLALVKDLQVDPVRQQALHVDFHHVDENKPVHTVVAIHLEGTPAGVKEGGILETQARDVDVEALPRSIPDHFTLDVSGLGMGDAARVGDLVAPEGVTILSDPEETVCTVVAPRLEEEPQLSAEELEALGALDEEELEELREYAEAVAELAPEEAAELEGEAPEGAEGDESGGGDEASDE